MAEPPKPPADGAKDESEKKAHEYQMPVFIGDTDAYAMMYHTNYLKHFERARLCLFGVESISRLQREDNVSLVELSAKHIRYFDSARLGEDCVVLSTLIEIDDCHASINHVCRRVSDSKDLNRMIVKVGLVNSNREQVSWPVALRSQLESLAPYSGPRMVGGAPKPFVRKDESPTPAVLPFTAYSDLCDASGFLSHHLILDVFEHARSSGLGGASTLKKFQETENVVFVVARMDNLEYEVVNPPIFGDLLEVRTVVQLKYDGACIIFHHELWRVGGEAPVLRGAVTVYSIHEATKKPSPIPPWLKAKLASFLVA